MAKFCMKCGKPLVDGVPCDCESVNEQQVGGVSQVTQQFEAAQPAQAVNQAAAQPAKQVIDTQKVGNYFSVLLSTALAIIKKPISAGKSAMETTETPITAGMIALQALLSSIFAMVIMGKVDSVFTSVAGVASLASREGDKVKDALKIPYIRIFFITLIASICLSAALAGILFAVLKIVKKDYSFTKVLNIVAIRSVVMAPIMLAAVVVSFISSTYGIGLFYFANIIGILVAAFIFPMEETQKDKMVYLLFAAFLVFMIVSWFIMGKLYVYYLPDTIKTGMSAFKGAGGIEGIFKGMLGGL